MSDTKKPEDFGITKNSFNELGLVNAVSYLFQEAEDQNKRISELEKKLEDKA